MDGRVGQRSAASGRGVVVRHQRDQRARDHRVSPAGRADRARNRRSRRHPSLPWVVSAKSATALQSQASRLAEFVGARGELAAADVGWSLAGRTAFEHRAVALGADRDQLLAGLAELADGQPGASVVTGTGLPGKTVFVFPGQGSQWLGMGMGLHATYPVFAEAFNTVVGELDRHLLRPLREVMWGHDEDLLNTTEFAQPALFAVEVALYRLLQSWGVRPDFVMGHSVGELTAAHVAGALSLENAALLVVARGRFMQALPAGGAMVAVQAAEDEVRPLLTADVGIAAVNGPSSVVVSGDENAVERDRRPAACPGPASAPARGVACLPLAADGADDRRIQSGGKGTDGQPGHHSGDLQCHRRTGRRRFRIGRLLDAAHPRGGPVRRQHPLREFGGRHPIPRSRPGRRSHLVDRGVPRRGRRRRSGIGPVVAQRPSRTRQPDGRGGARVRVAGVAVDWRATLPGAGFVELPTYAFERRRFWLSADDAAVDAEGLGLSASEHALLGAVVDLPTSGGVVLTGRLSARSQGWLSDHAVGGVVIFPGAGFVEMAIRAGDEVGCSVVDELTLAAPLVIPATGVGGGAGGRRWRRRIGPPWRCRCFPAPTRTRAGPCTPKASCAPGAAEPGADLSALAAAGRDPGRHRRALRAVGGARLRIRPGVPGADRDVAPRRRDLRRRVAARATPGCRRPDSGCTRRFWTPRCTR